MLATLPFSLNFAHPLAEWSLLAVGGWALYLGIKVKKTRTGTAEQRKELVPKKFAQRHYLWGSILLAAMTLSTLGGLIGVVSSATTAPRPSPMTPTFVAVATVAVLG